MQIEPVVSRAPQSTALGSAAPQDSFTLGRLAERGAEHWPHASALIDATDTLTFRELHDVTDRCAAQLHALGVQPGDHVAILGSKDIDSVVVILATARIGAIFIPLDVNLPEQRLRLLLDDCAPRIVAGAARHATLANGRPYLATERTAHAACASETCALPQAAEPSDVAYMIYTSGSTGRPKGVLIEHASVGAFFAAHNARAGISPGDRCMNTGPFHFDVSMMDVFLPLHCGASVVLTPELPMPKLLLATIERERITHFYAVGSVLALITGTGRWLDNYDLSSLRMLQTGAEICNVRVVNEWLTRLPNLRFLNSYGPTELTVGCTCYLKPDCGPLECSDVPIGSLHEGSVAVIVDSSLNVVTSAVAEGELLVSGAQMMRGYWNRPDEEALAFADIAGRRFYRTGDLVRRDVDGTFRYVGRRDDEVKVDGHRVHLSETKRCIEAFPAVASAVVGVVLTRQGRKRVGVAVVPRGSLDSTRALALLAHVAAELPAPFVPVGVLVCSELPRTSTGKADRRRVLQELERKLASSTDKVFFSELVPEQFEVAAS